MAVVEEDGQRTWWCDGGCRSGSAFPLDDDFRSSWAELRFRHNWTAIKDRDGTWEHYCPDCSRAQRASILDQAVRRV
jgi:hypothetical protein